jgi:class 3 adenylate cyclase
LTQDYRSALADYLAGSGEVALTKAYEIGRQAVTSGQSLLEIVELHGETLQELLGGQALPRELDRALKATEFLAECVAPCEMVYRGFQEANNTLRQLNQTLEERVKQRTSELEEQARRLRAELRRARSLRQTMAPAGNGADLGTPIDAVASAVGQDGPDLSLHTAPDGTVTILFSDIESSTELTQRLGDQRMQELVRAHNALVRQQLLAHGGFEVKSLGDGFMLAFSSARRALQCAIAIQREFAGYNAAQSEEPIRVRMGLHTGEAIKEEGDFYGKSVILAARIADCAQGEEILGSSLLKELAETAGDIRFGDPRDVELKGLPGTTRVYQVFWE